MEVAKGAPQIMRFDETELRLGLPGGGGGGGGVGGGAGTEAAAEVVGSNPTTPTHAVVAMMRKRGFSETVDLQLNLSSPLAATATTTTKEPQSSTTAEDCASAAPPPSSADKMDKSILIQPADPAKPPAKAQVVGWPPVRSFRKNMVSVQKSSTNVTSTTTKDMSPGAAAETEQKAAPAGVGASFVKVSMDGAPYLRKVDLKMYGSYRELSDALAKMFGGSGKDANDYVPTYEDKDGDWMLVGDVPWGMFVESCKRLRIMKGNEAIGLAPRGMEKRKNMS